MVLSKKLTSMDELMSCDPMYLAKVKTLLKSSVTNSVIFSKFNLCLLAMQVGREKQRFDFDDFDSVPQKFTV